MLYRSGTRGLRPTLSMAILCALAAVAHGGDFLFRKQVLSTAYDSEGAFAGDLDGDGKPDLVSGPYWYAGPDFKVRHEYQPVVILDPAGGTYTNNFMGWVDDVDKDGHGDIVMAGLPGEPGNWYQNPGPVEAGKAVRHWQKRQAFVDFGNESPDMTEMFGDGKRQVLFNTNDGYFCWAEPNPKSIDSAWLVHRISTKKGSAEYKYTHGLGHGDVHGDGRIDLLEKDGWWEQPASRAGDPVWTFHAFAFNRGGSQMIVYDVDGDGDADVISTYEAHSFGLAWYEQIKGGSGLTFKTHWILAAKGAAAIPGMPAFSQLHALALDDIDGDGLADLVTGKRRWAHGPTGDDEPNAPPVLYAFRLIRGDSVRYQPIPIDSSSGIGTQLEMQDLNGDGRKDILIGNKSGTFIFYKDGKTIRILSEKSRAILPYAPIECDPLGRTLGSVRPLWGGGVWPAHFTLARPPDLK